MYENQIDWFWLQEGCYISLEPDAESVIRSQEFPGLWLAVDALRQDDRAKLILVIQMGLQTEAHQTFVQQLNR